MLGSPSRARIGAGTSEPQVKSPGPTKINWSMMPMIVVAAQYRPRPAGTTSTNQANITGIIHCIIWFICACWEPEEDDVRLLEMRCWSHMPAKTMATSTKLPFCARSRKRKSVLSGIALRMKSILYIRCSRSTAASGVPPTVMRITW